MMIAFAGLTQNPPIPPIPPIPQLPPEIVIGAGGPPVGAIVAIVALLVVGVIALPLVRALARRLDRGALRPDDGLLAELEHLRARVAELEQVPHRMAELEERLDFSERLLTQRAPEVLKRGDDR